MSDRPRNFVDTRGMRIARKGKIVFVNALEKHADLGSLCKHVEHILHNPQTRRVILYFRERFRVYPNMMAPLAALLAFLEESGVKVVIHNELHDLDSCGVFKPLNASDAKSVTDPSRIVWRYADPDSLSTLCDAVSQHLFRNLQCAFGVLHSLDWCLWELMDNVLRHAKSAPGFFMYSLQSGGARLSLSVADQGQGIYSSFAGSPYYPTSASDAITLALRRGVSSSLDGAGWGLWGASEIITKNSGQLTINSGGGAVYYDRANHVIKSIDHVGIASRTFPGTNIDFQFDARIATDISDVLGRDIGSVDLRLERLEDDDGALRLRVAEASVGTATREAGREMRVLAQNLLATSERDLVIDFRGISMMSSSYADEFLARLWVTQDGTGHRLRLANLSDTVAMIAKASVAHRI